ncbi:MAG: nitroreductase family protein [Lachnospiraceae bacterium]|nr:nitroreductase family protein [Lachnospiraceae bacterium]MBR5993101.1 nitroreductase family protein [Lachnospiraceae bacterium]
MSALETIYTRSSCRCFQDKPLEDKDIRTILEAGVAAPTAHNTQGYKIVVIKDEKVKEASEAILSEMNQYSKWGIPMGSGKRSARILRDAPVNFFLFVKKNTFFKAERLPMEVPESYLEYIEHQNQMQSVISVGTVIENMLLAAEELKLGAVCISEISYAMNFCKSYFEDVIDLDEYEFASSLALGYKEDVPYGRARKKTVEELVVMHDKQLVM